MHLNDKNTFGDGILACMSRNFDIFMSKHLAGQWLLNSYILSLFPFYTDPVRTLFYVDLNVRETCFFKQFPEFFSGRGK